MGLFDFLKPDPAEKLVENLAVESGVMQRCPVCRGLTYRRGEASKRAAATESFKDALKRRDPGAVKLGDAQAFETALRRLCERTGPLCSCEDVSS